MTTATGRARAGERVYWVPDIEEVVQVQGEVEGRAESTGHGGVLSRPEASWCASWRAAGRVWACLGARGLGGVDVILVNGLQEQLQEGQGKAADMVEWLGWERRGGEHVE